MDVEEDIRKLHYEAIVRVDRTLKSINLALNLNAKKLREKKIPKEIKHLMQWKEALEYWKERYSSETNDTEVMAERLGNFYEICSALK